MKTAELTGALLDYWVAKAEGSKNAKIEKWAVHVCVSSHGAFEPVPFRPSAYWGDGGPLIEKYKISSTHCGTDWFAGAGGRFIGNGVTPLEAICRAVVRSVYGDEVSE